MLKKRIIPTLLTDGNNLVKGERFNSWRTVSSVVTAARVFAMRDVDELVLLDVMATKESRCIDPITVRAVADCLQVPFTVGGGIRTISDFEACLRAGADKVVIGTEAIVNPGFLMEASMIFGSQAVVACIDVFDTLTLKVAVSAGTKQTEYTALEAALLVTEHGAGEIILQDVGRDGLMSGMDIETIRTVADSVSVPLIASSGASSYEDMELALSAGASGVGVGALFQFTENTPKGARDFLESKGFQVRK